MLATLEVGDKNNTPFCVDVLLSSLFVSRLKSQSVVFPLLNRYGTRSFL